MSNSEMTRRQFVRDGAMAVAGLTAGVSAVRTAEAANRKILNFNENMEYRRLGKTGLLVSAVCLGGHWKRLDTIVPGLFKEGGGWMEVNESTRADLDKNRHEILSRCIEVGINYVDACSAHEVIAYGRAIKGRREKIYFGYSWSEKEMREAPWRTASKLLQSLEEGLKEAGLDYVDLWRVTMLEQSGKHTEGELEEMIKALETAKKQGKARFTGLSSHDRPHIKWMIEKYPQFVEVVLTPYTAKSKELPADSLFESVQKHNVGVFGIKPFASNALFKGDSTLQSLDAEEDDRRAREAIRYILCNPAITAPIPGLINAHQVDNVAKAVQERRKLDVAEAQHLEMAMNEAWEKLPADYQWLKKWEYV